MRFSVRSHENSAKSPDFRRERLLLILMNRDFHQTMNSNDHPDLLLQSFRMQEDELTLARDALREKERMLLTLMSNLDGMVYRCRDDTHWTMEFVSDGCYPLTGYRPNELMFNGRISYEEITHPDDRHRVRAEIQEALRQRRRFFVEYRIITTDGAIKWVWEGGVGI